MARQNHAWLIYLLLAPLALARRLRRRRAGWIPAGTRR
jgi:hypothetical protein